MPLRYKAMIVAFATVFLGFSLACFEEDRPDYSDDHECTEHHLGAICIVNQTTDEVEVNIDDLASCTLQEDEECCIELDSYGGPYTWTATGPGWEVSGEDYAPECDVRTRDVWGD